MANSEEFLRKVLEDLSPLGEVSAKNMFGGHGVFLDNAMFALISRDTLYFKADPENRAEFENAGMKPYGKMPYYQTPPGSMKNSGRLIDLARGAVAASRRGKKKKGKA